MPRSFRMFPQAVPGMASPADQGYPSMPSGPLPQRPAMPTRPAQSWADVIPQVLAAAGDVVSARGSRQTAFLPSVMGMQEARRQQSFQDQLAKAAQDYEGAMAERGEQWRGYEAGERKQERLFQRGRSEKEMELYEKMIGKQEKEAAEGRIAQYGQELLKAETPEDAKVIAGRLAKLYPDDAKAVEEAFNRMAAAFAVEKAAAEASMKTPSGVVGRAYKDVAGKTISQTLQGFLNRPESLLFDYIPVHVLPDGTVEGGTSLTDYIPQFKGTRKDWLKKNLRPVLESD